LNNADMRHQLNIKVKNADMSQQLNIKVKNADMRQQLNIKVENADAFTNSLNKMSKSVKKWIMQTSKNKGEKNS